MYIRKHSMNMVLAGPQIDVPCHLILEVFHPAETALSTTDKQGFWKCMVTWDTLFLFISLKIIGTFLSASSISNSVQCIYNKQETSYMFHVYLR